MVYTSKSIKPAFVGDEFVTRCAASRVVTDEFALRLSDTAVLDSPKVHHDLKSRF